MKKKLLYVRGVAAATRIDGVGQRLRREDRDARQGAVAPSLFGTLGTLDESSTRELTADEANADPRQAADRRARACKVSVVSARADLAPNIDQMLLWPNDSHPTHLIACNEQGAGQVAVQRINLQDGCTREHHQQRPDQLRPGAHHAVGHACWSARRTARTAACSRFWIR